MHRSDIDVARMDADLQFPLHIRQMFPELRIEYPEDVEGAQARVLVGVREGRLAAKFYFDKQSGLLLRVMRYTESPFGLNPLQVDYADIHDKSLSRGKKLS